jgi:hypothetical protein
MIPDDTANASERTAAMFAMPLVARIAGLFAIADCTAIVILVVSGVGDRFPLSPLYLRMSPTTALCGVLLKLEATLGRIAKRRRPDPTTHRRPGLCPGPAGD